MKTPAVRLKARIRWPFHRRGQPAGGYHGPHGRGGTPCHIGGGVECGCRTVLLPSRGPARSRRSRSWPEARETRRRQPSRRPGTKRAGARGRTGNARAGAAGRSASTTASMSRGDRHMTETEAHRPMGKTNTARLAFVVPTRRIIPTVKRLPPYVGAVCARGTGSLLHDDDGGASFNRKYKSTDPKLDWCTCAHAGSERPAWATSAGCWKVAERERYGWTRIL